MRTFKRHHDAETTEAPCPRCSVPVPVDAVECAVCGWDTRESYAPPEPGSSGRPPGTADDA